MVTADYHGREEKAAKEMFPGVAGFMIR